MGIDKMYLTLCQKSRKLFNLWLSCRFNRCVVSGFMVKVDVCNGRKFINWWYIQWWQCRYSEKYLGIYGKIYRNLKGVYEISPLR